ncbi:MAG: hypothetical protein ACR2Q4_02550 [Geminicoccaceae bacterium]
MILANAPFHTNGRKRCGQLLDPYQGYPVVLLSSGARRWNSDHGWVNMLANSGWERLLVATTTAREINCWPFITGT